MEPQAAEVGSGFLESLSRSVKSFSGEQKALEKREPLARSRLQRPGSMYEQGVLELELPDRRKRSARGPRLGKLFGCDLSILVTCSYYFLRLARSEDASLYLLRLTNRCRVPKPAVFASSTSVCSSRAESCREPATRCNRDPA